MKHFKQTTFFYLLSIFFLASQQTFAQVPQGINYQAAIRNGSGNILASQSVTLRFTIHQTSTTGATVYKETHALTTSTLGLVNAVIGTGTVVTGVFSTINWGNTNYFLQVEVNAGSGFVDLGTTQFMSVPYALTAGSVVGGSGSNSWTTSGNNIYNSNSGNVGIGSTNPINKLEVAGNLHMDGNPIFLRQGTGDQYDVIRWNSGADMIDMGGYIGVNLGYTNATGGGIITPTLTVNGGNVGIGTISPHAHLQLGNSQANRQIVLWETADNDNEYYGFGVNGYALRYQVDGLLSDHIFYSAVDPNNSNELMRIKGTGNVGIGIDPTNGKLDINAPNLSAIYFEDVFDGSFFNGTKSGLGTGASLSKTNAGTSTPTLSLYCESYNALEAGTNTGPYAGYFNGSVYTSGSYQPSDENLKENFASYNNALSSIKQLDVKTYDFKTNGALAKMNLPKGNQIGIMAQNIRQLFPELVKDSEFHTRTGNSNDENSSEKVNFEAVNYTGLIPVLVKGMQEQQEQIDLLNKQIEELLKK